jgi:hypothetical protein
MALAFDSFARARQYADLVKAKQQIDRLETKEKKTKEKDRKWLQRGLAIGLTNGTLFGWGWVNEKFGSTSPGAPATGPKNVSLLGIPVDLAVGGVLTGMSFMGWFGKWSDYVLDVGNGSLGAFAYRMGAELGHGWVSSQQQQQQATKGAPPQIATGAARVGPQGGRMHTVHFARP